MQRVRHIEQAWYSEARLLVCLNGMNRLPDLRMVVAERNRTEPTEHIEDSRQRERVALRRGLTCCLQNPKESILHRERIVCQAQRARDQHQARD